MGEPPVVDSSPLIYLVQAEVIDILRVAGDEAIVPDAVLQEIDVYGLDDPVSRMVRATPWLRIVTAPPIPPARAAWGLGDGEAAVLAWALAHPGAAAIIDDLPARRHAASLGIPVRGTLGLVILAKQRGVIDLARPVMERLRRSGMYLSDTVMNQALAVVDE